MKYKVAVLYQAAAAPEVDGIVKPMKDGGYADSGADIAYALKKQNIDIVTPVNGPELNKDLDWVFPDTEEGIQAAIDKGATIVCPLIIAFFCTGINAQLWITKKSLLYLAIFSKTDCRLFCG